MPRPDDRWRAHAQMAPESPWDFALICKTLDEHDSLAGPKLFPELAMYRIFVRVWQEHDVFFVEKSRQHMFTWIMCILLLWDAMHHAGRRNIIGSINHPKANKVTKRVKVLYKNLEKDKYPHLAEARKVAGNIGIGHQIEFLSNESLIESVPQGEDAVVSETLSNFFDDELHFQPDAEARFEKSMPAISGGGKYVGGGSPNGRATFGYRKKYAIDPYTGRSKGDHKIDSRRLKSVLDVPNNHPGGKEMSLEDQRYWVENRLVKMSDEEFYSIPLPDLIASCPGLHYWVTCENTAVFGMHYSAHPDHDPVTEEGRDWYAERRPHLDEQQWKRQMEICYDTFEGRPVISSFADNKDAFIRTVEYDPYLTLDLSWDPGSDAACCLISQKHKVPKFLAYQTWFLGEIFITDTNTAQLAQEVRLYIAKHFPSALNNMGNIRSVCDPAGYQRKETAQDNNLRTSIEVIRAAGFRYVSAKKVGVPQSVERAQSVFAKQYANNEPAVFIHPRCEMLIQALISGWRFPLPKDDRQALKTSKGYPEKDGWFEHICDPLRYRLCEDFPDGKDVLDARPESQVKQKAIYCKHTGRLKRVVGVNAKNRRGQHAYLSQRVS